LIALKAASRQPPLLARIQIRAADSNERNPVVSLSRPPMS
jgi:hypothetical protein